MNKNKNLIIIAVLIILTAILAPKLIDLTGKAIYDPCDTIGDISPDSNGNDIDEYCSLDKTVQDQLLDGVSCLNNFECASGNCQDGICRPDISFTVTDIECETDGDCEGDLICQDNTCVSPPVTTTSSGGSGSSGGGSSRWRGAGGICVSNWTCTTWSACIFGKKARECTDINDCDREPPIYDKPAEEMLCEPLSIATCSDGTLNQQEEEIDCGGPCEPCASCFDNVQNCHTSDCELGLDCGGPCMPCKHALPIILSIITGIIVLVLIILGIWYWRIKKSAQLIGQSVGLKPPPGSFRL